MSDLTRSSNTYIQPYRSPWGAFPMLDLPMARESSAQSFRRGAIVENDTAVSTAGHRVNVMSTLSTNIAGVAAENASSVTGTALAIWDANPVVEFKGFVQDTIAAALCGVSRGLSYDSSVNIHYINANDSGADARVVISGLHEASTIGDTGGWVLFRFRREAVHATSNSTTSLSVLAFHK